MTPAGPAEPERIPEGFFDALGISSLRRTAIFGACFIVAFLVSLYGPPATAIEPAARRALFILVFAGLLWVTEAVPAFAVGILVIGLNIALLGRPEGVFARTERDWEQFVEVLGHPLVWLFFGGFVLAAGLARVRLDRWMAARLMARLGDRPAVVLAGVMGLTFTLSMFMSNTATTAMVIALLAPLLAALPRDDRFGVGLLLGAAVAANLGGMGSLIGTPPNAIAVGVLSDLPHPVEISFLRWMLIGLPPGLVLLIVAWALIGRLYPSSRPRLPALLWDEAPAESDDEAPAAAPPWQTIVVAVTAVLTVGLWMSSEWHGLPTAVVSFVPIILLTTSGILNVEQIRGLPYDVLFLIAGGLALGQVVSDTGLSAWIVGQLPIGGLGVTALALVVAFATVALSNFMSNTAAANIVIPLTVTLATGAEARIALPVALAASAAMCLPIATPPNALVFATGRCTTRDFLRMGLVFGVITPPVVVLWVSLLGRLASTG